MELETPRLWVKPHTLANAEKYASWENDPDFVWNNEDHSDQFVPMSVEDARQVIRRHLKHHPGDDTIYFAVHTRPDDRLIGYGNIHRIDTHHRRATLGITIGEKAEWGKGYAAEALDAIIAYCFTALNMNRLIAEIYCFNERSVKLFKKLGFTQEGTLRQSVFKNGQFWDDCIFSLLRQDWKGPTASKTG